jgi:hypothetical protein
MKRINISEIQMVTKNQSKNLTKREKKYKKKKKRITSNHKNIRNFMPGSDRYS